MRDVLIVEDDEGVRSAMVEALAWYGVPHREASQGHEALSLMAEKLPAVVLLDMRMPVLDGAGFCAEVRARGWRDRIAIIVATASERASEEQDRCGADAYLGKPFDLDRLIDLTRRYWSEHALADAGRDVVNDLGEGR